MAALLPLQVQHGSDNDIVCEAIVRKLSAYPGISYAAIAQMAHNFGRSALAIKVWWAGAANEVPRRDHGHVMDIFFGFSSALVSACCHVLKFI